MADAEFTWIGHARYPCAWAARMALIRGTYTRKVRKTVSPTELLERLLVLWRARAAALHKLEWPRLAGKNLQYARNCPPFPGPVEGPPGLRRCRIRHLCPWCFALDVAAPAQRLAERAVKKGAARVAVGLYPLRATAEDYPPRAFMDYTHRRAGGLPWYWKKAGALGGAVLWTAAPLHPGGAWRGLIRVMLALPADPLPAEVGGPLPRAWRVWPAPDRRDCARLAGMFAVYPGGMLTAPAEDALALLAARGRYRSLATFGTLYGRK